MGGVTRFTYDAAGRVLERTEAYRSASAATTRNSYDANGNLVQVIDPRNNRRTMTYTRGNRLETESFTVSGVSYTRRYEYDALGRLWRTTNANQHAGHVTFDAGSRKKTDTNALNDTTSYTYDENGNVLTVKDPMNHVTTYTYDKLDRVKTVTDYLGNKTSYDYDAEGHLSAVEDARGNTTRYGYDADGRLNRVVDANNRTTSATYDAAGNLSTVTGPESGNVVRYTYDNLNRMTQMQDAENHIWRFSYDNNGNLTQRTMPDNRTIRYTYDELNRVTSITYADGSQVNYAYDKNGNRISMTDSLGTTRYSYDEANRLTSVTDPFGKTVSYAYDGVGNVTDMIYPGSKTLAYDYDDGERLETVTSWLGHTTRYSYNPIHQLTKIQNGNGTITELDYDNAKRLVELLNRTSSGAVISRHQNDLDGNGNVTQSQVELPLEPSFDTTGVSMTFDDANRILTAGSTNFTHDLAGRIVSKVTGEVTTSYTYNDQDLLTAISGGRDNYSFLYNGDGNRLAMSKNGVQTRYVLDLKAALPNVLAETNASGAVSAYYTYGMGLLSRIDATTGEESFYHFDPTGNTLALTDAGQNIVNRYAYTPYGEVTAATSTDNPFSYSGRHGVMDDGNGLNYMRARYYQPEIKRFLSLDALYGDINEPQSLNRYAYVQGNPIGKVDPSGKSWKAVGYFALAGVGVVSIALTAPAFAASGSIILGISLIGSTLGTAGSLAGGISQTTLELTISDKDKIEQMEEGIRDAVHATDIFWSGSYVASGGNEEIASYGEAIGNVYSLSTGFYSLSTLNTNGSNVVTLANGLTAVYDVETAVIKLSQFVGENLSKTNSEQKSSDSHSYYNRNTNQCVAE